MSMKGAEMNASAKTKQITDKWQCREQAGGRNLVALPPAVAYNRTFPEVFSFKRPLQSLQLLRRADHCPKLVIWVSLTGTDTVVKSHRLLSVSFSASPLQRQREIVLPVTIRGTGTAAKGHKFIS